MDSKESHKPIKKGGGKTQDLMKAKKELDKALLHLNAFPDFWEEVKAVREKVLSRFYEEEKKVPEVHD